jgi:hypothetical protein
MPGLFLCQRNGLYIKILLLMHALAAFARWIVGLTSDAAGVSVIPQTATASRQNRGNVQGGLGKMKTLALGLSLLLAANAAVAQQKPEIYNHLSPGGRTEQDQIIHDALDSHYKIIDFELAEQSMHTYIPPHPIAGSMPHTPNSADGTPIHGYVMLVYVISLDGTVASPAIVKCTAPQLCDLAIAATHDWRFDVATFDGTKMSTVALQEFKF